MFRSTFNKLVQQSAGRSTSLITTSPYSATILPTLLHNNNCHIPLKKFTSTSLQSRIITQTRSFQTSAAVSHGHLKKPNPGEELHITFITKDGTQKTFEVAEGDSILDIAQSNHLDMEGACGGSCACSTCHVIIDPDFYDDIPEPDDDENDMLDLAFGLTETSRLGCQVVMTKELDGIRVALPAMTRNLQARDFKN
ncbi:unnamed protein product [Ambrosiozyma monospora]|uniref:Unnamed protein product n=1 Tax=Ambrosiozyma monospora TaxID=43982 RepID=A0A9W7DJC8_AMBMO|nr:unnamed protein product [Ambrosiozyma monospora]